MGMHTRGPWQVLPEEVDKPYIRIRGTVLGGRYRVANVLTPTYEGVHEREAVETRANARLIAAAPYLFAELDFIANADPSKWDAEMRDQFLEWAQSRARAAIAKATGGAK